MPGRRGESLTQGKLTDIFPNLKIEHDRTSRTTNYNHNERICLHDGIQKPTLAKHYHQSLDSGIPNDDQRTMVIEKLIKDSTIRVIFGSNQIEKSRNGQARTPLTTANTPSSC